MQWQLLYVANPAESADRYQRLFSARVRALKDSSGESSFFITMGDVAIKLAGAQGVSGGKKHIRLCIKERMILSIIDRLIEEKEIFQVESISGNLFYKDIDGNVLEILCIE
ncbi:hypothetical protein ACSV5M_18835 [Cellvibrio sp. ARAG 10.3]|uniref:hypothetical protein n=1 Tax=Cellvibrio sp. ARAG 10.3 TaxID=3451358 RepID=UPI003F450C04